MVAALNIPLCPIPSLFPFASPSSPSPYPHSSIFTPIPQLNASISPSLSVHRPLLPLPSIMPSLRHSAIHGSEVPSPLAPLRQHIDDDALPFPCYLDSLDHLQDWAEVHLDPPPNLASLDRLVTPSTPTPSSWSYAANSQDDAQDTRPRLLVCHDFQGGYAERPDRRGYSFEHWHLADYFVYFSHHRVSIPPVGWVSAADRSATKMLGTLIFEWSESKPALSQLLRGPLRTRLPYKGPPTFSPYYADLLISLALERGFTGWLVNVEVELDLGFSCSGEAWPPWVSQAVRRHEMRRNAERLRSWVDYLRREGQKRCRGWEVVWYDSVTRDGHLAWQDAVTPSNADFFQAADGIFTNYTWARPPVQLPPGMLKEALEPYQQRQLEGYRLTGPGDGGYHPALQLSGEVTDRIGRRRHEVMVGIDVFGRNCYGGMQSWRSLDMVGPHRWRHRQRQSDGGSDAKALAPKGSSLVAVEEPRDQAEGLGFSVALFAPGWTWEHDEPKRGQRSWDEWWSVDRRFWVGGPSPRPTLGALSLKEDDTGRPVSAFFPALAQRPERVARMASRVFYTNFSLGSGVRWFVGGRCVRDWTQAGEDDDEGDNPGKAEKKDERPSGWTDPAAWMPKPDLLYAESGAVWRFDEEEAWSGGQSLLLEAAEAGWEVPICTVVVSLGGGAANEDGARIEASIRYRCEAGGEVWPRLCTSAAGVAGTLQETSHGRQRQSVGGGWYCTSVTFAAPPASAGGGDTAVVPLPLRLHVYSAAQGWIRLGSVDICSVAKQGDGASVGCRFAPGRGHRWPVVEGTVEWKDFDPHAPYYQVFVRPRIQAMEGDAEGEGERGEGGGKELEVWIATATREARRTEAAFAGVDLARLVGSGEAAEGEEGWEWVVRSIRDECQSYVVCPVLDGRGSQLHPSWSSSS
ncbi:hypothetical protein ACQY0O_001960 [Thecaphora frezii]